MALCGGDSGGECFRGSDSDGARGGVAVVAMLTVIVLAAVVVLGDDGGSRW